MEATQSPVVVQDGEGHDLYVYRRNGHLFARVWHSDKGEWTIDTVDGPIYRESSRQAAVERCERLAA